MILINKILSYFVLKLNKIKNSFLNYSKLLEECTVYRYNECESNNALSQRRSFK